MDSQTRREDRRSKSFDSSQTNTLLVQSLATETAAEDLDKVFNAFVGFRTSRIIYDPQTKKSQGFGYVNFYTSHQAQFVHQLFHHNSNVSMYLNERKILLSLALPAAEEERKKRESKAQKLMERLDDSTPAEAVRKRTKRDFNAVAIQDDYERAFSAAGEDFALLAALVQKDMEEHFPDDTEAERATRLISSVVACIQRLVGRIEEYQGEYFVLHLADLPGVQEETKAQQRVVVFQTLVSIHDNLNIIEKLKNCFPERYPAMSEGLQQCHDELRVVRLVVLEYTETPFNQVINFTPVQKFLKDGITRFVKEFETFEAFWRAEGKKKAKTELEHREKRANGGGLNYD